MTKTGNRAGRGRNSFALFAWLFYLLVVALVCFSVGLDFWHWINAALGQAPGTIPGLGECMEYLPAYLPRRMAPLSLLFIFMLLGFYLLRKLTSRS